MPLDGINPMQGKNFAPIEPLKHAKDTLRGQSYSSISSIFREICQEIEAVDDEAWRAHMAQAEVTAVLRSGKRVVKRDLSGDGYVFFNRAPEKNRQDKSNYPVFPSICEDLKAKWEKTKPQVSARAFGDGYRTEIQLHTLDRVVKSYFKDNFNALFELQEALSAQDFGTYLCRWYYDDQLNQMRQTMPILQDQSRMIHPGYGGCMDCSFEGVPVDFQKNNTPMPSCPDCGSYKTTKMVDQVSVVESVVKGIEDIVQGDIRGKLLSVAASKYDLRVIASESSYFRYEQYMPLRLLQSMYGDLNFQTESLTSGTDHFGLELMEALANRGGNTEGNGVDNWNYATGNLSQRAIFREYWLKPEWYAGRRLRMAEKTVSGTVPADVPFEQLWPNGVMVGGFNNMMLQTHFYAETARISAGLYYVMPFSGLGKGLSDGVDIAKDLSEMHSMAMADIKRHAAAGVVVDKSLGLTQAQVRNLFKPEGVVFANVKKSGFGNVGEAVTKLQFDSVNPVLPQTMVNLANLLNLVSLSGDFSEGTLQQVDINTLGGQQLATAKEEGKKGAVIAMKSYHRERSAEYIVELCRMHGRLPRYYPGESDSQGRTRGKWITGAEFPEGVKFDAVPDSAIAQSMYEKRLANREMLRDAGGIVAFAQVAAAYPAMAAFYARQFGVELPTFDQEQMWTVCLERIENIEQLSQIYDDPQEILTNLDKPLFEDETNHKLKADFIAEVLDDDEVASWNPAAKGAVQLLISTHKDLQAQRESKDAMRGQQAQFAVQQQAAQMQQAIMAPQMQQAQAAQQQAQQQQQDADTQNAVAGAAAHVGEKLIDDEQSQVEHERQMEREKAAGDKAIELEKLRQQGQAAARKN